MPVRLPCPSQQCPSSNQWPRAAAGTIRPDVGARIDRDSAFSGACFRTAQIVNCDDTETDSRVNLQACRKLGARSMVAVPLCGRLDGVQVREVGTTVGAGARAVRLTEVVAEDPLKVAVKVAV